MKFKRLVLFTACAMFLFVINVSADTQGITSGRVRWFPNYGATPEWGQMLGVDAVTTYIGGRSASSVQRIEVRLSHESTERRVVSGNVKQIITSKIILGPSSGSYVVYHYHDVDTGTERNYFYASSSY